MRKLLVLALSIFVLPMAYAHAEGVGLPIDVVSAVSKHHGIPESQAAEMVKQVFGTIHSELKDGRSIEVDNFGRFSVQERKLPQRKPKVDAENVEDNVKPATRKYAKFAPAEILKIDINRRPS